MLDLARSLISEAEFIELPETTEKVELIDGEITVSPSPSYWHQEVRARAGPAPANLRSELG
jgi:hypothetical protein